MSDMIHGAVTIRASSGTEACTFEVSRHLDVPGDIGEESVFPAYDGRKIMPSRLRETLTIHDDGTTTYDIAATGPVVTKTGRLHASQRAGRSWRPGKDREWDNCPAALMPLLIGEDALRAWLQGEILGPVTSAVMANPTGEPAIHRRKAMRKATGKDPA